MKKVIRILAIVIAVLAVIWLLSPAYLRKALLYQQVNIDDYKLFHNRTVANAQPQPWALDSSYNAFQLNESEKQFFDSMKTTAFLVIQNKKKVFEIYFDGYGPQSLSGSFSAAKSVVGMLVGCAIADGYIRSENQPVADFLPWFAEGELSKITLRHLLTMTSGVNWEEAYSSPFSVTTQAYYGDDIIKLMKKLKAIEIPGKKFNYLSCNTQLLGLVIEKATGKHLADYASDKLWKPLGAEQPALWSLDHADGTEKAYCCLNSNAPDFARFGQLLLDSGRWNEKQIIPLDYWLKAINPDTTIIGEDGKPNHCYGYQIWISNYRGVKTPYARGILGQYIIALPDQNAVVVRLGEKRSKNYIGSDPADFTRYVNLACKILGSN